MWFAITDGIATPKLAMFIVSPTVDLHSDRKTYVRTYIHIHTHTYLSCVSQCKAVQGPHGHLSDDLTAESLHKSRCVLSDGVLMTKTIVVTLAPTINTLMKMTTGLPQ